MTRKAPAFQFYVDDFIGGTHYMTASSVGIYVRLLCYQFANGLLPSCHKRLARIAGVTDDEFAECWEDISGKFSSDGNGHIVNNRLKCVLAEQVARSEARSIAGKEGGKSKAKRKQKSSKHINKNITKGVGVGVGEGEGIGRGSGGAFVPPEVDEVAQYVATREVKIDASAFVDFYTSKGWKVGNQPMKDWQAAVRTWEKNGSHKPASKKTQMPADYQGL